MLNNYYAQIIEGTLCTKGDNQPEHSLAFSTIHLKGAGIAYLLNMALLRPVHCCHR